MKRQKVDSALEKQFATAAITNRAFLAGIGPAIDIELFQSRYIQQVVGWALEYYRAYGKPPGRHIQSIYHAWVEKEKPEQTHIDAVHDFLEGLSGESDEDQNAPFLLAEAADYLTMRRISRLGEVLEAAQLRNDRAGALDAIGGFTAVPAGDAAGLDPLNDKSAWARVYAEEAAHIFSMPGAAGRFLSPAFTRDALIGIQAPEKRGKTFWCLEFIERALRARKRVALFEVGDLSESQIMRRFAVRITGLPMWGGHLRGLKVPTGITLTRNPEGAPVSEVQFMGQDFANTAGHRDVLRAMRRYKRRYGLPADKPYLMFSIHPMSSINVKGIDSILSRWHHEMDFVPDVIVIDYADILAPESGKEEFRHRVNETWQALRRLSQERHALVIAPTQASAKTYKAPLQRMDHFSEDKRKYGHVTGILGLNQLPSEKRGRVMRLNWIFLREHPYDAERCLYVSQCLELGRPLCQSALLDGKP